MRVGAASVDGTVRGGIHLTVRGGRSVAQTSTFPVFMKSLDSF